MTATAHLGLTIKQGATFREPLTRTTYPYPVRVECGQVVKECGTPAPDTDATPEDYTDRAVIPTKGDVPTVGFGSTRHEDGSRVQMGLVKAWPK